MRQLWILLGRIFLPILILSHSLIILGNIAALVILPLYTKWYIWIPLCTLIVRLIFDDRPCPATQLEDFTRSKLNKNPVDSFIKNFWRKISGR